ncbi:MAG TPA: ester cyclase [Oculatellaceae cyanobacterium]|jgi:hypothetical protein
MSSTQPTDQPLWIQDRETVIAHDDGVEWRYQERPDYSHTNKSLQAQSQYAHIEGSLEAIVQNLVRAFEMEATHKTNPAQWVSVVADKFRMRTNGGPEYTANDVAAVGTYNLFLEESEHYNPKVETFESSIRIFHEAFPDGFLWELAEVFSGPPNVTFKWRHWGTFSGPYKDHAPTGEKIEISGMTVARVNDDLKILSLEHFFDTSLFLGKLATGCPFHAQK